MIDRFCFENWLNKGQIKNSNTSQASFNAFDLHLIRNRIENLLTYIAQSSSQTGTSVIWLFQCWNFVIKLQKNKTSEEEEKDCDNDVKAKVTFLSCQRATLFSQMKLWNFLAIGWNILLMTFEVLFNLSLWILDDQMFIRC